MKKIINTSNAPFPVGPYESSIGYCKSTSGESNCIVISEGVLENTLPILKKTAVKAVINKYFNLLKWLKTIQSAILQTLKCFLN